MIGDFNKNLFSFHMRCALTLLYLTVFFFSNKNPMSSGSVLELTSYPCSSPPGQGHRRRWMHKPGESWRWRARRTTQNPPDLMTRQRSDEDAGRRASRCTERACLRERRGRAGRGERQTREDAWAEESLGMHVRTRGVAEGALRDHYMQTMTLWEWGGEGMWFICRVKPILFVEATELRMRDTNLSQKRKRIKVQIY